MSNRKFYAILAALTVNAVLMSAVLVLYLSRELAAFVSFRRMVPEDWQLRLSTAASSLSAWSIVLALAVFLSCVGITVYFTGRAGKPDVPHAGLRLIVGRASQTWTELQGDQLRIGWAPDNELRLFDPKVSHHHARIRCARGAWYLQDLDNESGTFVNGRRVWATRLNPGDRIFIGMAEFEFGPRKGNPR